ncbi:tyrosine-type recombinase/integrase [Chloroflexota bacterium]
MKVLEIANIQINKRLMKIMGKGKKERIVPIGSSAQRALQRYLFRYRPKLAYPEIDNAFLSTNGNPMTENSIKLIFAKLAQRSRFRRLHAHLCRRTFATRFLMNVGDVFTLQQILVHSTLEYVNLAASHFAIQHQKFPPLDRLNLRK